MEVRPLLESEKEKFGYIVKEAFQLPQNALENFIQHEQLINMRGLFDDKGRLVTGLRILRPGLWLGERPVQMTGITSVATPPEYRRHGYLKQLLKTVLTEEREQGRNISTLYPFEFAFYRKFGYELAGASAEVRIKLPAMADFKRRGSGEWQPATPADWQEFQTLYNQFCVGRFGRIERPEERWWRRRVFTVLSHEADRPMTLYQWRNTEGQTRAYIVYSFKTLANQWDRELEIRDAAWLDEEAYQEILSFIANHDSQAQSVYWATEPGDEIFARLANPREAEIKLEPGYMLRVLDVERALIERAWPSDEKASFSLTVQDDVLSWNNDQTYQVEINRGQASVHTVSGTDKAGLSCDVRALAQLYSGYLSPKQAARLGKLTVLRGSDLEGAQRVFSPEGQPASFMADHW